MQERVLVVDDDPDILQFVQVNLELEGYSAESAENGRVALDARQGFPARPRASGRHDAGNGWPDRAASPA